jgi:hypothetical protein
MKDVTGIHDASLGIRSNEVSGRAIMARQREGDVANLTFHDNANAALVEAGDVLNQLIPQIYDGTRILRTIGEDQEPKFVKVNDPYNPESIDLSVGNYDIALSTGASYTTRRVEAAQSMMDAIQVWPDLMGIAGDLVAAAQDWPGAEKLAERLKKTIPQHLLEEDEEGGAPMVTPEQAQEMQAAIQELQMALQEKDRLLNDRTEEFEIDRYNAATQRIRALSDNEVDNTKLNQDGIKTILEYSHKLDDMDMNMEQVKMQMAQKNTPTPSGQSANTGG